MVSQIILEHEISMDSISRDIGGALHIVETQIFVQWINHRHDHHLNSNKEAEANREGSNIFQKSKDCILWCNSLKKNQGSLHETFGETREVLCSQIIKIYQRNGLVLCDCSKEHLAQSLTVKLSGGAKTFGGWWEIHAWRSARRGKMASLLGCWGGN